MRYGKPMLWTLSVGLVAATLGGCATAPSPGAGADGSGTGAGAGQSLAGAGLGAGAGEGRGQAGTDGVPAPGAALFPGLPSPKDFAAVADMKDIYFEFDRAAVRPEDTRVLDANARWLQAHPGTLVLIEGHADARGTTEYNLALGESRAKSTREQLVARGVAPSRITIVSYGEERPACQEAKESCWAQNRRARFLVGSVVASAATVK